MQDEKKRSARLWPVLKAYGKAALKYPLPLFITVLAVIGIQVAAVVSPLYLKQFVDILAEGIQPGVIQALIWVLVIYALINFAGWIFQHIRMLFLGRTEAKVMADLYDQSFTYLLGHSHDFFISNFAGTLTRRVTRYARAFESVLDNFLLNIFPAFLFIAGVVIVLSFSNVWISIGLFIWTVIFIYVQIRMMMWLQPLRTERTEEDSHMTGSLSDAVTNQSAITSFAALSRERSIFSRVTHRWYTAVRKTMDAYTWIFAVQGLLALVIEILILVGFIYFWQKGFLTIGDLVLIQLYVIGVVNNVWDIGRNMRQLYDAFSEATEMLDIIELPHGIKDVHGAKALVVKKGAIVLDAVSFEYRDGASILRDFNLTIEPREKVAFIGASGAGKSTIAKLLLRLYDLTSGEIRIDGENIAQVTQESLRRAISFVPQEPTLFHRSLMDNIRYGREDATDAEVISAAKQAHCYEFISQYPEGFATMVGERGVKLSGGERQRVAIARAILKNAPILVLDEATSSLDSKSESLIQDALARLMEGKTVIAIAHRLSTVMKMDRLIVIEKGSVVLTGTHDELLAHKSNLYKKLWEIQAGGFIRASD